MALTVVSVLVSGCISTSDDKVSFEQMMQMGQLLMNSSSGNAYQPSSIGRIEAVRSTINSLFVNSQPVYQKFVEKMSSDAVLGSFMAASQSAVGKSAKRAVYDALPYEHRLIIDRYIGSYMTKDIYADLGDIAKEVVGAKSAFESFNVKDSFKDLDSTTAASELVKMSQTTEQLSFLSNSILGAVENYDIVSGFIKN